MNQNKIVKKFTVKRFRKTEILLSLAPYKIRIWIFPHILMIGKSKQIQIFSVFTLPLHLLNGGKIWILILHGVKAIKISIFLNLLTVIFLLFQLKQNWPKLKRNVKSLPNTRKNMSWRKVFALNWKIKSRSMRLSLKNSKKCNKRSKSPTKNSKPSLILRVLNLLRYNARFYWSLLRSKGEKGLAIPNFVKYFCKVLKRNLITHIVMKKSKVVFEIIFFDTYSKVSNKCAARLILLMKKKSRLKFVSLQFNGKLTFVVITDLLHHQK